MTMEDVTGGKVKIGNTVYEMVEAKYNGTVVWPLHPAVITYQIITNSVVVTYSAGNTLYASGSNYVTVTANVEVYADGVYQRTISGATLTPTLQSGSHFYISGDTVKGYDLALVEQGPFSETVTFSYQNDSVTRTITQEENVKTKISDTAYGSKKYGTSTTEYMNYQLNFYSNKYNSQASPAPASGATTSASRATLTCTASHIEVVMTPWTQDATITYSYTSRPGQTFTETETDYYSGTESSSSSVSDTTEAVNSITGSATGFTRSGLYVTVASEGSTEYQNGRSVTYTAKVLQLNNNTYLTVTETLYQEANVVVSYTYDLSVDIDVTGTIGCEEGRYDVNYTAKRAPIYTSGAEGSATGFYADISGTNCTPSTSVAYHSGKFTITVPENTAQSQRDVTVTLTSRDDSSKFATDTVVQDAAPAMPHANVYPDLDTDGRVRVRFYMTQGTVIFPVVISGMEYHYVEDGGASGSRSISGDITIQSDGDAVRLGAINTWLSGASGMHWFSATSVSRVGLANTTFTQTSFDVR